MKISAMILTLYFDSCAYHPPKKKDKKAVEKLLKLHERGDISVLNPSGVEKELSKAPSKIAKARLNIFNLPDVHLTEDERQMKVEIRGILFGHKSSLEPNDKNDVDSVFECCRAVNNCRYFVTVDEKHILSKASIIKRKFELEIVSPSECLVKVEKHLEDIKKWQ